MKVLKRGILFVVFAGLMQTFQGRASAADPDAECRLLVRRDLEGVAFRAQRLYHLRGFRNGAQGSFAVLSLGWLVATPYSPHGQTVLSSPSASSVTLTGWIDLIGDDGFTPLEVEMIVYADSMTVTTNN